MHPFRRWLLSLTDGSLSPRLREFISDVRADRRFPKDGDRQKIDYYLRYDREASEETMKAFDTCWRAYERRRADPRREVKK